MPGSRQVISQALRNARKDLALLALTCSLKRALARRQLASSAPDKNQLQQIAKSLEALRAAQGHAWALGRRFCNKSLEALRAAQGHAWALGRRV